MVTHIPIKSSPSFLLTVLVEALRWRVKPVSLTVGAAFLGSRAASHWARMAWPSTGVAWLAPGCGCGLLPRLRWSSGMDTATCPGCSSPVGQMSSSSHVDATPKSSSNSASLHLWSRFEGKKNMMRWWHMVSACKWEGFCLFSQSIFYDSFSQKSQLT
jgi:hypothetical protein